ncbi:MAG: hypothetical protein GY778_14715 [bacterium]|nr:hypothetical protein [bacterium]
MPSKLVIGLFCWGLVCALVCFSPPRAWAIASDDIEVIPDAELPEGASSGQRLVNANLRVAAILNQLDIDGDGLADNSPDSDGDGLPDNWEIGGFEAQSADGETPDRVVFYPSPAPIVPGTPPTPIFTRLAVATSALNPDTDGDGVTDFVEVFGLIFIDENLNGVLDGSEWNDKNDDGLPSPGEWPLDNSDPALGLLHDFDGFVFTDPTNADTDGDSRDDAVDNDPLVNPRAFGNAGDVILTPNLEGDEDKDNDGLGNGMDLGNDLVTADGEGVTDHQELDNPQNIGVLIGLFRPDLSAGGVMPEAQIEDLLGADWDSNGVWRTTDVREWSLVIDPANPLALPPDEFFDVEGHKLWATQTFDELDAIYNDRADYDLYGGRGVGLGWHNLLKPAPDARTDFLPDRRVWAVLYSWRMPGFDIDGDGFVGTPIQGATVSVLQDPSDPSLGSLEIGLLNGRLVDTGAGEAMDDYITLAPNGDVSAEDEVIEADNEPTLNGRITAPEGFPALPCGTTGIVPLLVLFAGLVSLKLRR